MGSKEDLSASKAGTGAAVCGKGKVGFGGFSDLGVPVIARVVLGLEPRFPPCSWKTSHKTSILLDLETPGRF